MQPWIELNIPFGSDWETHDDEGNPVDSFRQRGLMRVGVQFKTVDGTFLIGDINKENGGCGCCGGRWHSDVVLAYRDLMPPGGQ